MNNMGGKFGNSRKATILKCNNDGTVTIALDEIGLQQTSQEFIVPFPLSWSGPFGEFIGGYPVRGSSVMVKQSQGGRWVIDSYIPNRGVFTDSNLMGSLKPGRALIQVKGGNKLFVDPSSGIFIGNKEQYIKADPNKEIVNYSFNNAMMFTESNRKIDGLIKRDIKSNVNRNTLGSSSDSHIYDDSLTVISMDSSISSARKTSAGAIRNPALVESREVNYEFANSFNIGSKEEESIQISDSNYKKDADSFLSNRTNTLNINLNNPNYLIETIKGTVVDLMGNILDLNRSVLSIGNTDKLSLNKNPNKSEAYINIQNELNKSIAYHFELNARKSNLDAIFVPNIDDTKNYARNRSRFYIDIDKEGQFKINVPQSSETGNIPLLTRYENYHDLASVQNSSIIDKNALLRNDNYQDIFLDSFTDKANIKLKSSDSTLDGYAAPIDRFTNAPIMFGTVYHDITKAGNSFLTGSPKIHFYEDNPIASLPSYDKFIENVLIVSGKNANGGGRSGMINLEGFLNFNIGANTSDRQSLWLDCAGGIVSQIGRDKRGISHLAHLDGDMLIQIGGPGIGNKYDSRFEQENDNARIGALEIRIIDGNRPMTIIRVDKQGIQMTTEGVLNISAAQGMVFQTQGDMQFNAERIGFYTNTGLKRIVERNGIPI